MHLLRDPLPARSGISLGSLFSVVLARARFLLLLAGVLGIMTAWPVLANYWDKWTRPHKHGGAISSDTEYWCPMCPGVVSDWSTKCPVCNMSLVRRKKGEMTPLPDGVVARVQLSPYRVQLAGIRTAEIDYRRLEGEIVLAGRMQVDFPPNAPGTERFFWSFQAEVSERDSPFLKIGQTVQVTYANENGETIAGRIASIRPFPGGTIAVKVEFGEGALGNDLKPGTFARAKVSYFVSQTEPVRRQNRDALMEKAALAILCNPQSAAWETLVDGLVQEISTRAGLTLCVPESAVIDMGHRKVAYLESMPGMYDAVEVKVGRRYGDHFPVLAGLAPGQKVAATGAVLLDAETRLNPSLAAAYFGATKRGSSASSASASQSKPSTPSSAESGLSDEALAKRQQICPVTGEPLDSMGGPVKVDLDGRSVFVCCKSCEKPLRKKPAEYLAKLPK